MNEFSFPVQQLADGSSVAINLQNASGAGAGMAAGLFILFLLLSIAATVLWIITLVSSAKSEQWVWFVLILVFGPLVSLVYMLIGQADQPRRPRRSARRRVTDERIRRRRVS